MTAKSPRTVLVSIVTEPFVGVPRAVRGRTMQRREQPAPRMLREVWEALGSRMG